MRAVRMMELGKLISAGLARGWVRTGKDVKYLEQSANQGCQEARRADGMALMGRVQVTGCGG